MSVNKKMTDLADAIRAKSGVTEKLSIDRMTTAVNGLFIGVNTFDATAQAEYIMEGLTAYARGEKITGTLPRKNYSKISLTPSNPSILDIEPYYSEALAVSVAVTSLTVTPGKDTQDIQDHDKFYYAVFVKGDPNLIPENIVKGKTIFGVEGAADIGGNSADVTLGQVNADGDFQALSFNGTEASNSGDPEVVETYYTYNGVLPVPEYGGGGSGGGSADFYKCAEVFGPEKVSGFIVSGAGASDVNGRYFLSDMVVGGVDEIYKNENNDFYLYRMGSTWYIAYTMSATYAHYSAYYLDAWTTDSAGEEPPPAVAKEQVTVDADTPKTWNGYKAVWSEEDGYSFEETVTENLSYGSALVPVPGGVYDSNARIEVSKLFESVKPITTNDTACLIYIDGSSLTNQALAPNKHDISFGSGVNLQNGVINTPHDSSGRITTTGKADGYGGTLTGWTWDFYFISSASYACLSGHSDNGWCLEASSGNNFGFRGTSTDLGVVYNKGELIGLSMQWDNGVLHVWNKGKYVGTCAPSFPQNDGKTLGIGCDGWNGNFDRMTDQIKLFRFSNKARYTPGVDFELPEGFIG